MSLKDINLAGITKVPLVQVSLAEGPKSDCISITDTNQRVNSILLVLPILKWSGEGNCSRQVRGSGTNNQMQGVRLLGMTRDFLHRHCWRELLRQGHGRIMSALKEVCWLESFLDSEGWSWRWWWVQYCCFPVGVKWSTRGNWGGYTRQGLPWIL